jgi:hypothetical protein
MISAVFDIPAEFIENSIKIGIQLSEYREKGEKKYINDVSPGNDLKSIYFAGQTLCLDTRDEFGQEAVITLSWDEESFGLFSGGPRRLLSLNALRDLDTLMKKNNINHDPKLFLVS